MRITSFIVCIFLLLGAKGLAQSVQIPYDGVFIVQEDGRAVELIPSEAKRGYYVTGFLGSFWKYPKKWFTLKENITTISSFKKLIIKGAEYDSQTMKNLEFLSMDQLELGMPFFHMGEYLYKSGTAYIAKPDSVQISSNELRKNSISHMLKEATVTSELKRGPIYAFWVNQRYYMMILQ